MTTASARYARHDDIWFLKLGGDVRHTLAPALASLLDRALADPGATKFVIDLVDTDTIDSTCLGVLARIGSHNTRVGGPHPVIICPDEDIRQVLLAICFDRLFDLVDQAASDDGPTQPLPMQNGDANLRQLMLDAHQQLCAIDERNRQTFRDVVQALEDTPDG